MGEKKRLRLAWETAKGKWKLSLIITIIFVGFAALYVGMYPSFEDMMGQIAEMDLKFIRGFSSLGTYEGFLNMELYQIFWILVLPVLIAYVAGSLISEEIESGTIDLLLSNPISRKRIVLEKFLGILPMILLVTFATMGSVYGMSLFIGEEISLTNLFLTHLWSVPYFLSIAGISLFVSTVVDKKMKSSIIGMAFVVAMYLIESVSQLTPDYDKMGVISIVNYFDPSDLLVNGEMSLVDPIILAIITLVSVSCAVFYFDRRDIT